MFDEHTTAILLVVFFLRTKSLPELDDYDDVIFKPVPFLKGEPRLNAEVIKSGGIHSLSQYTATCCTRYYVTYKKIHILSYIFMHFYHQLEYGHVNIIIDSIAISTLMDLQFNTIKHTATNLYIFMRIRVSGEVFQPLWMCLVLMGEGEAYIMEGIWLSTEIKLYY